VPLLERFTLSSWLGEQAQPILKFVMSIERKSRRPVHRVPAKEHTRFCRVCGQSFCPVRFDALTCSDTCRRRKSRGADLAYLASLPPDQARARRMVHDADESTIFIARMAGASRREGRRERRGVPKVRRMKAVRR